MRLFLPDMRDVSLILNKSMHILLSYDIQRCSASQPWLIANSVWTPSNLAQPDILIMFSSEPDTFQHFTRQRFNCGCFHLVAVPLTCPNCHVSPICCSMKPKYILQRRLTGLSVTCRLSLHHNHFKLGRSGETFFPALNTNPFVHKQFKISKYPQKGAVMRVKMMYMIVWISIRKCCTNLISSHCLKTIKKQSVI